MGFKKYEGQGWRAGWIQGEEREKGKSNEVDLVRYGGIG